MSLLANNPELRNCFEADAVRLVYQLQENLQALTQGQRAASQLVAYHELVHTLRGAAALVEVTDVSELCTDFMRLGEIADSYQHSAWDKAHEVFQFVQSKLEIVLQAIVHALACEDTTTAALCQPIRNEIRARWNDFFYDNNITEAEGGFEAYHNAPETESAAPVASDAQVSDFLNEVSRPAPSDTATESHSDDGSTNQDAAADFLSSVESNGDTSGAADFLSAVAGGNESAPVQFAGLEADLLPFFYEDALTNLSALESALGIWEQNSTDLAALQLLHRSVHTIKGAARTAGLAVIGDTANAVEDVIEDVLEHRFTGSPESLTGLIRVLAGAVYAAVDELRALTSLNTSLATLAAVRGQADVLRSEATPSVTSEAQTVEDFLGDVAGSPDFSGDPGSAETVAGSWPDSLATNDAPLGASSSAFEADLLPFFYEDALTNLEALELALSNWESNPEDIASLQAVYRHTHTIKGAANSTGLPDIGRMVHSVEDVLEDCVEKKFSPAPASLASLVYEMADAIKAGISELQASARFNASLKIFEGVAKKAVGIRVTEPTPVLGREQASAANLEASSPASSTTPVEAPATDVPATASPEVVAEPPEADAPPLEIVPASQESAVLPAAGKESLEAQTIRISSQRLDAVMNLIGELIISRTRLDKKILDIARLKAELNFCKSRLLEAITGFHERFEYSQRNYRAGRRGNDLAALGLAAPENNAGSTEGFSDLEFDRYDEFNIMARSLVETGNDISEVISQLDRFFGSFNEESGQFNKSTTNLQNEVTRIRMVPLTLLFRRLQRSVRDAATREGKDVEFRIAGGETQLDKNIVDEIYSPLLHLVRNSVSHGIESAEVRLAAGKTARGLVSARAFQESNQVVIEVSDDGGGLNYAAIRSTAIERGLITADAQLSEDELTGLIFRAGFSTAKTVSQISGRGVGMDVVSATVSRLNGSIEVRSVASKGCTFTVRLPLTLAINQAMMISVAGHKFALPLSFVEHIVPFRADRLIQSGDAELWRTEANSLPLVRLDRVFGLSSHVDTRHANVVLVRVANKTLAVLVDEQLTRQDIVVKPLGSLLQASTNLFSGATLSGDGEVIMILDLPVIEENSRQVLLSAVRQATPAHPARSALRGKRRARVLVADDSLSVRKVAEKYLAAIGYEAVLAVDGLDALEKLRTEDDIAAVLTDLEMPRMHGYELIAEIRQSANFRELPVVVVTSRDAEKHRKRAAELGASGYITKPFTREQLAERLEALTAPAAK